MAVWWCGRQRRVGGRGVWQTEEGVWVYPHLLALVSFPLTTLSRKEKTEPWGKGQPTCRVGLGQEPTTAHCRPPCCLPPKGHPLRTQMSLSALPQLSCPALPI